MPNASRLLDISLGSDAPDYFNGETLDPFNLYTEVDGNGKVKAGHEKSLLQKINLSHLRGLNKYLDVRSPDKLQEFRALDTSLKYALFADGAPLNTVHLPNTVTRLVFNQNKELKKLITSTPQVAYMDNGVLTYYPHESYEGLFVDGVTNYTDAMAGQGSPITELSFEGDALGYGSYTILKNVVARKNGTGRTNRLKIRMADIAWTPYVQVEYGETKIAGTQYYYLTDHSTYEPYDHADNEWYTDTLNGKVYTYDNTKDESIITDLSLLDLFYDDKNNTPAGSINQFTNNIESMDSQQSYPTISGDMYISNENGTAIAESDLTNKYAVCWPNLKIRAAKVDKAYIAKYVQRINGKDNELDIIRYAKDPINDVHPTVTSKTPALANYDFMGWTLDPAYVTVDKARVPELKTQGKILENNNITALTFSAQNDIYVFYAVFAITSFAANFYNADGTTLIYSTRVDYGSYLSEPLILPAADESQLEPTQRYRFIGWKSEAEDLFPRSEALATGIVNLSQIKSQTMDKNFYACYVLEDVHDRATDSKYFDFVSTVTTSPDTNEKWDLRPQVTGYKVRPKAGYTLYGKITIPASYNNKPIVSIDGFHGSAFNDGTLPQEGVTHIYFMGSCYEFADNAFNSMPNTFMYIECPDDLQLIGDSAFEAAGIHSFTPKTGLKVIGSSSFKNTPYLKVFELPYGVTWIGSGAFNAGFNYEEVALYKIPGSVKVFNSNCLSYTGVRIKEFQIGDIENRSQTYSELIQHSWPNSLGQNDTTSENPLVITYWAPKTLTTEERSTLTTNLEDCVGYYTVKEIHIYPES